MRVWGQAAHVAFLFLGRKRRPTSGPLHLCSVCPPPASPEITCIGHPGATCTPCQTTPPGHPVPLPATLWPALVAVPTAGRARWARKSQLFCEQAVQVQEPRSPPSSLRHP